MATPEYPRGSRSRTPALAAAPPAGARLGLAAVGVAMAALMGLGLFRESVVRAAPRMASAYAAFGLRVNLTGLEFSNVAARTAQDGGRRVLAVGGEIANPGGSTRAVPQVRVALSDAEGGVLYSWTIRPPKAHLSGGEKVAFTARLSAPPTGAFETTVDFDPEGPAPAKRTAPRAN